MVRAWYMDESDDDRRLPHTGPSVPMHKVARLGVQYWKVNAKEFETDAQFKQLREKQGYSYMDAIEISPDKLPGYEQKIKMFYEEHLHADDEIRLILSGSGYFDVRNETDRWIRIECTPGDMISLPTGVWHRFTLDSKDYIKAARLFKGNPVWTPINRSQETNCHPAHKQYVSSFSPAGNE